MKYKILFTFLVLSVQIISQNIGGKYIPDFLISTENNPSTFYQSDAYIFNNGNDKIICAWKDPRGGDDSYYAQFYDSAGQKIAANFQVKSNSDFVFYNDDRMVNLFEETYYSSWFGSYSLNAAFYNLNGELINEVPVWGDNLPECGTGWLGITNSIAKCSNYFLIAFSFGGSMRVKKLQENGSVVPIEPTDYYYTSAAARIACGALPGGEYAVLWFKGYNEDNIPIGLYANFFNSTDSLIAADVPIKLYSAASPPYFYNSNSAPRFLIESSSDTSYQLILFEQDSLLISVYNLNKNGSIFSAPNKIYLPNNSFSPAFFKEVTAFCISNKVDGKRKLFTNVYTEAGSYPHTQKQKYNAITTLDDSGFQTGEIETDTTELRYIGKSPYLKTDGSCLLANTTGGDVFLERIKNFNTINSSKINDDETGSVDVNPVISLIDDNNALVVWNDELGCSAQIIDAAGNRIGEKKRTLHKSFIFFSNGTSISLLKSDYNSPFGFIAFAKYDNDLNVQSIDTIYTNPTDNRVNFSVYKLKSDNFILFYSAHDSIVLSVYDKTGALLNKYSPGVSSDYNTLRIYKESDSTFWAHWNYNLQLFSNNLVPQSSIDSLNFYPSLYVGNRNFLIIKGVSQFPIQLFVGQIVDRYGVAASPEFTIGTDYNIKTILLPSGNILTIYGSYGKIFGKVFNQNGEVLKNEFTIHDNSQGYRAGVDCRLWNDKALFAWNDSRTIGNGYDIYGAVYNLSDLSSVKSSTGSNLFSGFSLEQNYPNPFNPTTKIQFTLPSPLKGEGLGVRSAVIKIYDILGREVQTLMNKELAPGSYEVEFNTSSVNQRIASGVYIYTLQYGSFSVSKKMQLIK